MGIEESGIDLVIEVIEQSHLHDDHLSDDTLLPFDLDLQESPQETAKGLMLLKIRRDRRFRHSAGMLSGMGPLFGTMPKPLQLMHAFFFMIGSLWRAPSSPS